MPLYDYKCKDHGVFHDLVSMHASGESRNCPRCGQLSPRIIMIPPEILRMAPARRAAMEHNEKSRHEPIISTPDKRSEATERRQFQNKKHCGCGHNHHGSRLQARLPDQSSLRQQAIYLADGSKVFPSQRPWMISH